MFRFRLEKVLRYRKRQVEQQARRLRACQDVLQNLQERRKELLDEAVASGAGFDDSASGSWAVQERQRRVQYLAWLQEELRRLQPQIEQAVAEVVQEREILTARHRGEQVLCNLRRSQQEQWDQEEFRRQRKEMDQISGRLRHRRRGDPSAVGKNCRPEEEKPRIDLKE